MLAISLCHSNADGNDIVLDGNEHVEPPTDPSPSPQQPIYISPIQQVSKDGPIVPRPSSLPIPTSKDPLKGTVVHSSGELESSFSSAAAPAPLPAGQVVY